MEPPLTAGHRPWRHWVPDLLGVAWVLAAAVAVLVPALVHGVSLGPYDVLSKSGLSSHPGVTVHNPTTSDQIQLFIPWTTLVWTQVHHGQLPLWNPYSALGMPLALNWESAPFGLPALLSYLFPLHLVYTVQVMATLAIAGTGVYVLGRILRLGVLGSVVAAIVYELSGPFMGLLGWSATAVMSWAPWLFAAALLVIRGHRRLRAVAFYAVAFAFAIYAGEPEIVFVLGLGLAGFLIVLLGLRARWLGQSAQILRSVIDLAVATIAGVGLAAPLMLPGLQVANLSVRASAVSSPSAYGLSGLHKALPWTDLVGVFFQGFEGLPIAGSHWFGDAAVTYYPGSATYVGVIAVVLALTGMGMRWRNPEVLTFGAVAVSMAGLAFAPPLVSLVEGLPKVGGVLWHSATMPMALAIAVLAGVGTDAIVRSHDKRAVQYWAGGGFAGAGVVLLAVWVFGRGKLDPVDAAIRARSFIWPTLETALGLAVIGALFMARKPAPGHETAGRRRQRGAGFWVALSFLVCETAFLVTAGSPLFSSSHTFLSPTPAEVALQHAVGSSVVGGGDGCFGQGGTGEGILPNVNDALGVQELAVYDPMTPLAYFRSWRDATGESGGLIDSSIFCPVVQSATVARRYGVGFVIEPPGAPGPQGADFDMKVGNEELYRVPGAAAATLTPIAPGKGLPTVDALGRPVHVTHPDPAAWNLVTSSTTPQVLRLRLTDVPGWHATIDGRPLQLRQFGGVMLQALIPPGRHLIQLSYWPTAFTVGIALAACSVAGLSVGLIVEWSRRHKSPLTGPPSSSAI